ncbi:MAG TPA: cobaltochelatase subunit CobS, partial [Allosphingosinicella sp.]
MSDLPNANPASRGAVIMDAPDQMRKVRDLFGID